MDTNISDVLACTKRIKITEGMCTRSRMENSSWNLEIFIKLPQKTKLFLHFEALSSVEDSDGLIPCRRSNYTLIKVIPINSENKFCVMLECFGRRSIFH
mmetsp:Transcript_12118/g.18079  ORF Transcript_12118/g.18079 Transcript_12118/m.18079 type:complete len:99 (-) Transcript_12118:844-1140(-)